MSECVLAHLLATIFILVLCLPLKDAGTMDLGVPVAVRVCSPGPLFSLCVFFAVCCWRRLSKPAIQDIPVSVKLMKLESVVAVRVGMKGICSEKRFQGYLSGPRR